jgi:lipoate-protein ligase A
MPMFEALMVYQRDLSRSAALNMAIDEALLGSATLPSIRFYQWRSPALSFGYFGRFADVASYQAERDLVRRWTGGGIVLHGNDLTYSIVIPASNPAFAESSNSIYERIHRALAAALAETGKRAVVAAIGDRGGARFATPTGDTTPGCNNCFANPVQSDVIMNGRKVAGAAQRRTCAGLLHQGSIQNVELENDFAERFARELSQHCELRSLTEATQNRAQEIAEKKYETQSWLRKR